MNVNVDYDLNRELEVISIEDHLQVVKVYNEEIEYFYFNHRLDSRVPTIIIIVSKDKQWNYQKSIVYFCKIGNVLSLKVNADSGGNCCGRDREVFSGTMRTLLRKYGTVLGIVICYDEESVRWVCESMQNSTLLQSEVRAIVAINSTIPQVLPDNILKLSSVNSEDHTKEEHDGSSLYSCDKSIQFSNKPEVMNALILRSLQEELREPCLQWIWQYEQSDQLAKFNQLVLKNLEKWRNTPCCGEIVEGTCMVPMKLMRDDSAFDSGSGSDSYDRELEHSPQSIIQKIPKIGLIIDLSNDEGSYDVSVFKLKDIEYERIQIESKVVPSSKDISTFIKLVRNFNERRPEDKIVVHCHYGYNRTGLMICSYLIEEKHLTVEEALERFKEARPPGIKHQNYIDKLFIRYSDFY